MKQTEFLIAIDFGIQTTKIVCWDMGKNDVFLLQLGKDTPLGVIPTVVTSPESNTSSVYFFDKPRSMEVVGDMPIFSTFLENLFHLILANNSFLSYNKEKGEWNFLIVISYPTSWKKEEGRELLDIVNKIIPPARYAIKGEERALGYCCDSLTEKKKIQEGKLCLLVDVGSSKIAYLLNRPLEKVKIQNGVSLCSIEKRILEKATICTGTNSCEDDFLTLIQNDKIQDAEYFLIKEGRHSSNSNITKQWNEEAVADYCLKAESVLTSLDIAPEIIILMGGGVDLFARVVSKVFPKAEILKQDIFGICYGMVGFFQNCFNMTDYNYIDFSSIITDSSAQSQHNIEVCKHANSIISFYWRHNLGDLKEYVTRDTETSYNSFIKDIEKYIDNTLPNYLTTNVSKELETHYVSELNNIINNMFGSVMGSQYLCNNIENYFSISLTPLFYGQDNLSYELTDNVFNKLYKVWDAKLNYDRDKDERRKAYDKFVEYLEKSQIVDRIPHIYWSLLENREMLKLYLTDCYCLNNDVITITRISEKSKVDLNGVLNAINYSFNIIVDEGLRKQYVYTDDFHYSPESQAFFLKKFDFETYLMIKQKIGDETIELSIDNTYSTFMIDDIMGHGRANLYFNYPHIYRKLKDFFNINIFDLPHASVDDPDTISIINHAYGKDGLYDIVIRQYLAFAKQGLL